MKLKIGSPVAFFQENVYTDVVFFSRPACFRVRSP